MIGFNLYAYCSNNPVVNRDDMGTSIFSKLANRIRVSVKMVLRSFFGGGKKKSYERNSSVSVALQNSNKMRNEVKKNVRQYKKTGGKQNKYTGTIGLYDNQNDYEIDLSYSVGKASYSMEITRIEPMIDFMPYNKEYYLVEVTLFDSYDFDEYRSVKGLNDCANNMGYALQNIGIVSPYEWDVSYRMIIVGDDDES